MAKTPISSQVDEQLWEDLQAHARESRQSISDLLTEAIAEYLRTPWRSRNVQLHLDDSIRENEELGRRFAD